jgi:hypothetical protein
MNNDNPNGMFFVIPTSLLSDKVGSRKKVLLAAGMMIAAELEV